MLFFLFLKFKSSFFNKKDTLIGLRDQLDEVKAINVEMYQKMQVQKYLHPHLIHKTDMRRSKIVISMLMKASCSHFYSHPMRK